MGFAFALGIMAQGKTDPNILRKAIKRII